MLYFIVQVVAALAVGVLPAIRHWPAARTQTWLAQSVVAQFAYGLLADGLLVAGIAWLLHLFHWHWSDIGLKLPKLRHIALGLAATIPYYALYFVIVAVVSVFVPSLNLSQKQDIGFTSVHGLLPTLLTFISLVVLPPLAEETVMRGFLYTGLRKWLPKIAAGLLVSVLFGAAHLAEGGDAGPLWIGAIDTFTLSLVLVYLREKTGNLGAGMALHAAKNCVAFVSLFIISAR